MADGVREARRGLGCITRLESVARLLCSATMAMLAGMSLGCGVEIYRAETTLHADGRVSRAIYQPESKTPEEARASGVWTWTQPAPEIRDSEWERGIRDLRPLEEESSNRYFAAAGEFASVADMPEHFVKRSSDGERAGRLKREFRREAYPLVTEYVWEETLTDVVSLDDLHLAREETLETFTELAMEALRGAFGDEHDVSRVESWLRGDARSIFVRGVDALYEISAGRRADERDPALQKRLLEITSDYGISLADAEGRLLKGNALEQAIRTYVQEKLTTSIIRKGGGPPDESIILAVQRSFGDRPEDAPPSEAESRLQTAWESAVTRKFGSREAFEAWLRKRVERILGVYQSEILAPPKLFRYEMTVPGIVVETNGELAAENRVEWEFTARDAYPLGFRMFSRSLAPDRVGQETLLGRVPLTSREKLIQFVGCLEKSEALREALQTSLRLQSLAPLEHHLVRSERRGAGGEAILARRVWRLLELPE